jgi:transposase
VTGPNRPTRRSSRALAKNATLPTEDVPHPVPPELCTCASCGGQLTDELPAETSTTYEYVPGRFVRRRHLRQKLACRCGRSIVTAPPPPKLVKGGQYGPGFAAFLIVEKCADSIPIYRIEKRMTRLGIPISRATMNDILHAAAEVARPLYQRLEQRIRDVAIVLADETSARLQDRTKRGFMWTFHGCDENNDDEQLVLYVFSGDRSGETPVKILGGSEGALVVDGYTGYNFVDDPEQRLRGGCWSHARRKFFEARTTAPPEATAAIDRIRGLFRVEHEATVSKIVGTKEHLALRLNKSVPILDELYAWLHELKPTVLPKSPIASAINYAINQEERLRLFLTDPRIPIHNNSSESRLRVIALGRKNYLFFGHIRAAKNFAGLYSLVGTCIANGVEPTAYLTDVLLRVQDAKTPEELDALLPARWAPAANALVAA